MTIRQSYNAWAASYDTDRNLTRDLDAQVTRTVLGDLRPAVVLETGCGTGKNTAFFAEIAARVLALDFSRAMISRAESRSYAASVAFALADLTQPWPCAVASTSLVACNLVLEHIADLDPVFVQARRVLEPGGKLFICELHPFLQYQGKKAVFHIDGKQHEITTFTHHTSDFLRAASRAGFALQRLDEWWHAEDTGKPPRLISLLFEKS